jgi:hypothetical protein
MLIFEIKDEKTDIENKPSSWICTFGIGSQILTQLFLLHAYTFVIFISFILNFNSSR